MGRGVNIFLSAFAFGCKKLYLCISKGSTRVLPFFRFRLAGGSFGPNGLSKGLFRACKRGCLSFSLRPFDLVTTAKSHPVFNFSGKRIGISGFTTHKGKRAGKTFSKYHYSFE